MNMPVMAAVSQKDLILSYLHQIDPTTGKRRGISPLEAIGLFRVFRLAARIEELRAEGHKIETVTKRDTTNKVYARYFLRK
jgi:hypothetical protein